MIPNAPIDRLQYVLRQHDPVVAFLTLRVALMTLGADSDAEATALALSDGRWAWDSGGLGAVPIDRGLVGDLLSGHVAGLLRQAHDADRIFPWVATQLAKRLKAANRLLATDEQGALDALWSLTDALSAKGSAIALWAKKERVDLGRVSAEQALEAIKDFVVERKGMAQGKVVYRFQDGWTVQELPPEALKDEGEVMQHCVGGYCEAVESGDTIIYSLRDTKGQPHVTMERDPKSKRFQQVYGKQNERPEERYAVRVREWMEREMGKEPLGWLMAGGSLVGADLRKANLREADLREADLREADLREADLRGVDLRGADLRDADLRDADLRWADLYDADFSGADLTGATGLRLP